MCQEMFHTAGHNKKILSSFLCAGYANGQKDSCEVRSFRALTHKTPFHILKKATHTRPRVIHAISYRRALSQAGQRPIFLYALKQTERQLRIQHTHNERITQFEIDPHFTWVT